MRADSTNLKTLTRDRPQGGPTATGAI